MLEMAPEATTLLQLVLLLTWTCINMSFGSSKHPIFSKVLSSQAVIEQLLAFASLAFAPGLFEVLQASTPPTVSWFKAFPPTMRNDGLSIFLFYLEKPSCRPKIYIGSGTNSKHGVHVRLTCYDRQSNLPIFVERALKDGYSIVHKGILCWIPIPLAADQPVLRVLFIALEATFSFVFWAMQSTKDNAFGMGKMCKWSRDTLEYDGLCSHSASREAVAGDFDLSTEELEAKAAEILKRFKEYQHNHYIETKAKDPVNFLARKREIQADFYAKNPGRNAKNLKSSKDNAVKEKRHYCAVCDFAFRTGQSLKDHLKRKIHLDKVALVKKSASQSSGL
jgi:hypothetical protein